MHQKLGETKGKASEDNRLPQGPIQVSSNGGKHGNEKTMRYIGILGKTV